MKIEVGEVVFAPFKEQMWPGKIIKIDIMAEIKFFKIKGSYKIPPIALQPFNEDNIKKLTDKVDNKLLKTAIKMAEKSIQAVEKTEVLVDKEPEVEIINCVPKEVKEQEENANCKEEEEDDQAKEAILPHFDSFLAYVLTLDLRKLLEECSSNNLREFIFFNDAMKRKEKEFKHPKTVVISILELNLLNLLEENQEKKRLLYQKKVSNIFNSAIIDLQACFKSNILKLVTCTIEKYQGSVLTEKQDETFLNTLKQFRNESKQKLQNYLEDFTQIANIIKPMEKLMIECDI